MYLLIKVEGNYADEFDIDGFSIIPIKDKAAARELEKLLTLAQEKQPKTELGFGTNEFVYLDEVGFSFQCIKNREQKVFSTYFNRDWSEKISVGIGGHIIESILEDILPELVEEGILG